jgi:hypothetical protein
MPLLAKRLATQPAAGTLLNSGTGDLVKGFAAGKGKFAEKLTLSAAIPNHPLHPHTKCGVYGRRSLSVVGGYYRGRRQPHVSPLKLTHARSCKKIRGPIWASEIKLTVSRVSVFRVELCVEVC